MRACLLATALARSLRLSESEAAAVYWTTLLRSVGCTATSHEYAAVFGDDVAVRARADVADTTVPREALALLWAMHPDERPGRRLRALAATAPRAKRASVEGARADCEVGARMARRFELDPAVEQALLQVFERWDGKGAPRRLRGEAIAPAARFAAVASAAVMFEQADGRPGALDALGGWAGRALDPSLVSALVRDGGELLDAAWPEDAWVAAVAAEPWVRRRVGGAQLDAIARAFADAVDLKTPFLHGHSGEVAALAERAAGAMSLPGGQVAAVRRAGLFHDLGRAGVPTGTWEKATRLTTAEWELVRLHPYHTERILGRAAALAPLARLAGMHHERLDGSGYHRGAPAAMLDLPARVLAAADVYQALVSDRPHRPAYAPAQAAKLLEAEALDRDAVRAVIEAAGLRPPGRPSGPFGLTRRELEVLRLLVRGRSERQIARELFISGSTVHTHVVHIYGKAEVSTRAGLAMFAMEHDLVRPGEGPKID
jgi:HD-GYP domain-containing protein (c-di-GMP phosphodiesterase class II)